MSEFVPQELPQGVDAPVEHDNGGDPQRPVPVAAQPPVEFRVGAVGPLDESPIVVESPPLVGGVGGGDVPHGLPRRSRHPLAEFAQIRRPGDDVRGLEVRDRAADGQAGVPVRPQNLIHVIRTGHAIGVGKREDVRLGNVDGGVSRGAGELAPGEPQQFHFRKALGHEIGSAVGGAVGDDHFECRGRGLASQGLETVPDRPA